MSPQRLVGGGGEVGRAGARSRLVVEGARFSGPVVAVHGGAGTFQALRERGEEARVALEAGLRAALDAGWEALVGGGGAVRAAVEAVACMEDSGLFNAGRGSVPTTAGIVETDAGVMDGATRRAGGICAATWPANPVRAALAVARLDGEPVPVLLAGAGADQLAKDVGLAPMSPGGPGAAGTARTARAARASRKGRGPSAVAGSGTVGAVALDAGGHLGAATSTGGLAGQRPGRIGDSAIAGAGTWADDRTVAVSATGTGEAILLAGFAHRVDWSLREEVGREEVGREEVGREEGSLEAAVVEALEAVLALGGRGGAVALSPSGELSVVFSTPAMARGWRAGRRRAVRVLG